MGVSKNRGTPKSWILIGFSIIFTIHFGVIYGTTIFGWKHPYGGGESNIMWAIIEVIMTSLTKLLAHFPQSGISAWCNVPTMVGHHRWKRAWLWEWWGQEPWDWESWNGIETGLNLVVPSIHLWGD